LNGTGTHLRFAPHSLSARHARHVASEPRAVPVHVNVSGSHAVSPQRAASVPGVHATHVPALHTGAPLTCAQSASDMQDVHAFEAHTDALALGHCAFVLQATHVVPPLAHTCPAPVHSAASPLVHATHCPAAASHTGVCEKRAHEPELVQPRHEPPTQDALVAGHWLSSVQATHAPEARQYGVCIGQS
jgi:hypothetical protein